MDDDLTSDLDLNLEPSDSSSGSSLQFWSLLDELENAHGQIEERIRQLEAVTARARQRQRRRNTVETASFHVSDLSLNSEREHEPEPEPATTTTADRARNGKRGRACLVAEALGLDTIPKVRVGGGGGGGRDGDGGGFFDCNVCFDMAKEPVLTSCGHLFCWACFHQLPYVYSTAKECPSCKGEIAENRIVPIYGNGGSKCDDDATTNLGFGSRIPPRPKANRVQGLREQRDNRRASHIPVAAALRRIRMGIDASNGNPNRGSQTRHHLPNPTSVSTISSALNSAERLVEDLESFLHNRIPPMEAVVIPEAGTTDPPSDEEQLARMITNAGSVSFARSRIGLVRIPEVAADDENETSHEIQRRRLI